MAPFSIPAPSIIPLRLPVFGGSKSIDTNTKIELSCSTYIEHEIFYTLDGTKPQPYAGIVQGSKIIKYSIPFYLPAGKITIKAVAINSTVHTMCSSVVTKCFDVIKVESEDEDKLNPKVKKEKSKLKKKYEVNENGKNNIPEKFPDIMENKSDSNSLKDNETHSNYFEVAFIGSSDFDAENSDLENSVVDEIGFPIEEDLPDSNGDEEEVEEILLNEVEVTNFSKDSLEGMEGLALEDEKNMDKANVTLTDSGTSFETQFCCLKCDLTLQHCSSCNKMNAVSSKFCVECGQPLVLLCAFCKKYNPNIAVFCQYCGKKIGTRLEPFIKTDQVDHGVMVKPELKNASSQKLPTMVDKCIQTINHSKSPIKGNSPDMKRLPHHSPGRGYWHQQLDYICNHLKCHAYNNLEFRKEISEPSLCDFKSAHITKEEDTISVTVVFTPLVSEKSGLSTLEGTKPEDKKQDST